MSLPKLVTTKEASLSNGDLFTLPCDVHYYYIETDEQAEEAMKDLMPIAMCENEMLAIDIETSGLDQFTHDIVLFQVGTLSDKQYLFDARKVNSDIILPLLTAPCWKVGHNLKFEGKFFKEKLGVDIVHMYDTMLAEMVIRGGAGGRRGYALDQIIFKRLGMDMTLTKRNLAGILMKGDVTDTERAKKVMQLSFTKMEEGEDFSLAQLAYAASDVSASLILQLTNWQLTKLMENGPNTLYNPMAAYVSDPQIKSDYDGMFPGEMSLWNVACLEFKFLEVVIDMELRGIGFDTELHKGVVSLIEEDYKEFKQTFLEQMADGAQQTTLFGTAAINADSPAQVLDSLQGIGIPIEDTAAKTLDEALLHLDPGTKNFDILKNFLNYRSASKLVTTYGVKLRKKVHHLTKRLHYTVLQMVDTGRISTSNPNLQNIPAKISWKLTGNEEVDNEILTRKGLRECFIPRPGYKFLVFDYGSQELRIAAHITQDVAMLRSFVEGKDLHSYSASMMYHRDYDELHSLAKMEDEDLEGAATSVLAQHKEAKGQRDSGKTLNFGCLYGSGPHNIASSLRIEFDEATRLQGLYWDAYPQVADAMKRYTESAIKYGYSNTVLGRRRYYTDILDKIIWTKACKTPEELETKVKEFKMPWLLDNGPIAAKDMAKIKGRIISKFEAEIGRKAGNHHIQGTAADMTKKAAITFRKELLERGYDAFLVGLVHDELIVEVNDLCLEEVQDLVRRHMVEAFTYFCPTVEGVADGKCKPHWCK